jgi:Rrf2 family nitric oxide-sensitive transcriptional repressor
MQLTRFSDLSLRLLLYLASHEPGDFPVATVRASSELFNVPYAHLVKVVHRLGILGLVITNKGKGGGIRLSQPAEDIRLGQVLRQTEPLAPIINCFEPVCPLRSDCLLKSALDRAKNHFFEELDKYSLADVAQTPSLKRLVQLI